MPQSAGAQSILHPKHPLIKEYYSAREILLREKLKNESSIRAPFASLLRESAKLRRWTYIDEVAITSTTDTNRFVRPDGQVRDKFSIPRGWWEAKDPSDKIDREIARKRERGYPLENTIFENSIEAVLFQNGNRIRSFAIGQPEDLTELLNRFFTYQPPLIQEFEAAVDEFSVRIRELAGALDTAIQDAHRNNQKFQKAFENFYGLCRQSLNPNLSTSAVDEMLIQHLLTERLISRMFDNPDFVRKNVIAHEVENLVQALVSKSFSRSEFLRGLDTFYITIERTAATLPDFSDKQQFLNRIYERFFQSYSVKTADTHGIVYTPQPVVDFMCASVAEILDRDFGVKLGDPSVHILDPATGTGNFIVNLLGRIPRHQLRDCYSKRLFANEVMLLPYYIAALNIEHRFLELAGDYQSFEGLCFVDTLDTAESRQPGLFAEENTKRVQDQRKSPINVIIGNPPYNVGQLNENDNNKNRKYKTIDARVKETYSKDSVATNRNSLSDVYVKFFRWASDRLDGRDGIVCFVSNNSFVDQLAFDGMRKHLLADFTYVEHLDLHGNVRKNPKLSGTTHNVFGIQVGVGLTFAVRRKGLPKALRYFRLPEFDTKDEKLVFLNATRTAAHVPWQTLTPDSKQNWRLLDHADEFDRFMPISEIFELYSIGVKTNRDDWVYDFDRRSLQSRMRSVIDTYNSELDRYRRTNPKPKHSCPN